MSDASFVKCNMDLRTIVRKTRRLLGNSKARTMGVCLLLSFVLWLFITFGANYQYNFEVPVHFINKNNPEEVFYCSDSIIMVNVSTNGFEFLLKSGLKTNRQGISFDVNALPLNHTSGQGRIPTEFLKPQLLKAIGMNNVPMAISPDTVSIRWNKTYRKSVPVVNRTRFSFKPSFQAYKPLEMLVKEIDLEGEKQELDKVDTVYTKKTELKNIDRSVLFFLPLDTDSIGAKVSVSTTNIPAYLNVCQFIENVVDVPIETIHYDRNEKVRLYPNKVRLKYRVAMQDYKTVKADNFSAYVICRPDKIRDGKKLKVFLSDIPEYVRVVSYEPMRVDYVISR